MTIACAVRLHKAGLTLIYAGARTAFHAVLTSLGRNLIDPASGIRLRNLKRQISRHALCASFTALSNRLESTPCRSQEPRIQKVDNWILPPSNFCPIHQSQNLRSNIMSIGTWSFNPIATSFPGNVLPNTQFWSVTNGTWEYQLQLSYPLNWTSTHEASTVDTM